MSPSSPEIAASYSESNPLMPMLRAMGWGALVNLGYYPPMFMPALIARGVAPFQRDLAARSTGLLQLGADDHVLDAACGRGYTSDLMARTVRQVMAVDLVEDQIKQARERFGTNPRIHFVVADVTDLRAIEPGRFPDQYFDKAHCLEAAFHFGPLGRRAFLEEMHRVLKPGGRLVLVDLVLKGSDPSEIHDADPQGIVRDTWSFEEIETLGRYRQHFRDTGFRLGAELDWSRPVMERTLQQLRISAALTASAIGRRLTVLRWPELASLGPADWRRLTDTLRAHGHASKAFGYTAFVLDKPL
ncbi:class I SAM-dependent methyltransferase [Streptomyces sp. NBC_01408]|uniref:class I SAM-dependent methyltransferase n=1 Tax=Streptomyces sp. NBC_01408 TaxID=2903855 RepID=UPI00225C3664|nr:class I SAM-dependent methyltransferase [Streptomyces sp. NBC_01408]MCX4695623.1 class I SAM-dependent methyltransferase [Streptomyces sp. NBC_01408]